jgi:hypothetical protein
VSCPADEVLFTVAEAATFFDVSRNTVWYWINHLGIRPVRQDRNRRGHPDLFRFGELARAERVVRASPRGRPRKSTRLDDY